MLVSNRLEFYRFCSITINVSPVKREAEQQYIKKKQSHNTPMEAQGAEDV
jgi:hypothetical protein